ncbi:hypothetical protein EVAR_38342_1 [Eumeta japonica]|uniref:Uncharacterized protein n=1 Tax=Eumeta variegata TaxID=151549 RepID=A0A4C1X7N2_EUMVA|nr:hypothetical protein EVAR_38342_1 [Eumeta japonica]
MLLNLLPHRPPPELLPRSRPVSKAFRNSQGLSHADGFLMSTDGIRRSRQSIRVMDIAHIIPSRGLNSVHPQVYRLVHNADPMHESHHIQCTHMKNYLRRGDINLNYEDHYLALVSVMEVLRKKYVEGHFISDNYYVVTKRKKGLCEKLSFPDIFTRASIPAYVISRNLHTRSCAAAETARSICKVSKLGDDSEFQAQLQLGFITANVEFYARINVPSPRITVGTGKAVG